MVPCPRSRARPCTQLSCSFSSLTNWMGPGPSLLLGAARPLQKSARPHAHCPPPQIGADGRSAQASRPDSPTVAPQTAHPGRTVTACLSRFCCTTGIDGCRGVDYHSMGRCDGQIARQYHHWRPPLCWRGVVQGPRRNERWRAPSVGSELP